MPDREKLLHCVEHMGGSNHCIAKAAVGGDLVDGRTYGNINIDYGNIFCNMLIDELFDCNHS